MRKYKKLNYFALSSRKYTHTLFIINDRIREFNVREIRTLDDRRQLSFLFKNYVHLNLKI